MKLVLKQRLFSWFDSYDVCDEYGNAVFSVKGRLAWGHLLEIYDNMGNKVGVLKEKVLKLFPTFEIYIGVYSGAEQIMYVSKELLHLTDTYVIDVYDDSNALAGLLIALAIDAEKCSDGN